MLHGPGIQDLSRDRSKERVRMMPRAKTSRAQGKQHAQQHAMDVQHWAVVSRGRQLCLEVS